MRPDKLNDRFLGLEEVNPFYVWRFDTSVGSNVVIAYEAGALLVRPSVSSQLAREIAENTAVIQSNRRRDIQLQQTTGQGVAAFVVMVIVIDMCMYMWRCMLGVRPFRFFFVLVFMFVYLLQ